MIDLPYCRMIVPYFDNPGMLELQRTNWDRLEGELRHKFRIIVVDDCSPQPAAPILQKCKADVRVYRLLERIPWNMHQCRNIGAKVACLPMENMWLFFTDIDIMVTPEAAFTMLSKQLDPGKYYTVERTFAPDFSERKRHANTFLVKHAAFWQVNGYDLDLTPVGGGGYGGDNQFIRQLAAIVKHEHLSDVVTIGYGRRTREGKPVLPDADTTSLDRAEWHEKYKRALKSKKLSGDMRSINPIRTKYERVL